MGCGWFLTYRTIQTLLPVSKRLNCDLISRREYPSRNPTSPLDCRAADRSVSSHPSSCLHYMLHFQPSPLAFLRRRTSTAQRHKCALQTRERSAADGRTAAAGTGATCQSLLEPGGLDGGFVYSTDLDRGLG